MNLPLLSLLRCPRCRYPLDAEGDPTDRLTCRSCATSFPIERGVPRLAGETYSASFGRQWNRYDVARPEEDEATFRVKTGLAPRDLAGRLVLDAGCGGGRYARLLGQHGARVLGVDLSSAVDKASELCAGFPQVAIVQGDLLDLPVAEESFDLVYSI
ncbi:MAG: methyltransferase domain-containing protein, partial [Isosphaeraceae bacterium]